MRHILFDLDGTLIDSAPSILASFAAVLDDHGLAPTVPLDSSIIGPPLLPTLQRITGIDDPDRLAALAATFKAHYDETGYRATTVYAGIAEALAALRKGGDRLYIVTNKRIAPTRKILDFLGWTDWFAGVYAQDAFTPALPSKSAVIAEALRCHEIPAAEALYVGDRQEDGEAALDNRLPFIWVRWGYGTQMPPDLLTACQSISSPNELPAC